MLCSYSCQSMTKEKSGRECHCHSHKGDMSVHGIDTGHGYINAQFSLSSLHPSHEHSNPTTSKRKQNSQRSPPKPNQSKIQLQCHTQHGPLWRLFPSLRLRLRLRYRLRLLPPKRRPITPFAPCSSRTNAWTRRRCAWCRPLRLGSRERL